MAPLIWALPPCSAPPEFFCFLLSPSPHSVLPPARPPSQSQFWPHALSFFLKYNEYDAIRAEHCTFYIHKNHEAALPGLG